MGEEPTEEKGIKQTKLENALQEEGMPRYSRMRVVFLLFVFVIFFFFHMVQNLAKVAVSYYDRRPVGRFG